MNARRRLSAIQPLTWLRAWWDDRSGATLVQFVAVLPVFILIVFGVWSLFVILSAHERLCEATGEAARYLQVEAAYFEDDTVYPDDWIPIATDIINAELRSNALSRFQVAPGDVTIGPPADRVVPGNQADVSEQSLRDQWFFVRATGGVTNPLAFLYNDLSSNQIKFACQSTGYVETEPLRSTDERTMRTACPIPRPVCTKGPGPTACFGAKCPTPEPCPCEPY